MHLHQVETKPIPRGDVKNIVRVVREEHARHVARKGLPSVADYKFAINSWLMDGVSPAERDPRADIPL